MMPFPHHPFLFGPPTKEIKMPNEPGLYKQLKERFVDTDISMDRWHEAVRTACKDREYWLETLIREVGLGAVTEVFEMVLLELDVANIKLATRRNATNVAREGAK